MSLSSDRRSASSFIQLRIEIYAMIHRDSYQLCFFLLLRKVSFCIGCACLVLMNSDTASCKLQQIQRANSSIDPFDPFSEISEPLPDPFESVSPKAPQKSASSSQLINPQQGLGNGLASEKSNNSPHVDEVMEIIQKINAFSTAASRPVFPQRTQPGGLISSTCVDPFMTGQQEKLLWSELQRIDGTNWNGLTLEQLFSQLRQSLPIRVRYEDLETEGIDLKSGTIQDDSRLAGPIGFRLRMALKPLGLAYECRGSAILISTESNFEDGDGQKRIYDVTPLVSQVRDGIDQLINNLTQSITPDDWLQNGGCSVMNAHVVPAGNLAITVLIVDAPFYTHLEVMELLDRLNQLSATDPPPSDLNRPSTFVRQQTLSNAQSTVQLRTSPSDF